MNTNIYYNMMKKFTKLAYAGAIALLSIGFSACSSSDDVAEVNPTYDGNAVRTDFAFNINMGTTQTRMTGGKTQQGGTGFRGMQDMYLFSFSEVPARDKTANNNIFPLGSLTNVEITASQSSKIYALSIPVGTNNFLFYGKAKNDGETKFQIGSLESSITTSTKDVNDITFSLDPICTSLGNDATNLAAYLTAVAGASYTDNKGTTDDTSDDVTTSWASTVTLAGTDGNFRSLAQLYSDFTTPKTGEVRSGSVENIKEMILRLYRTAKAINQESSNTTVAGVAGAICTAIKTTTSDISVTVNATDTDPSNWTVTLGGANADFPANLNLPMGAAQLSFTDANTFTYAESVGSSDNIQVALSKINYPAELVYFDNSPIITSNVYKKATDYPVTTAGWDATSTTGTVKTFDSDWTRNSTITPSTRAVAMQNNVNYGVALLESDVKLASNTMTDNMKAITGSTANQSIDVSTTDNALRVTGLLIGGQPAHVEWDMTHTHSNSTTSGWNENNDFDHVIYDKDVSASLGEAALTTSATTNKNYTVVLDNYTADTNGQKNVKIALEIKNGKTPFYGKYNLIPANSTFYLVGELDLSKTDETYTPNTDRTAEDSKYRITQESTKRVFVQDYKTVAKITISSDALADAYSTIPDLTTSQVVFGLSVDLNWEPGITFSVEM